MTQKKKKCIRLRTICQIFKEAHSNETKMMLDRNFIRIKWNTHTNKRNNEYTVNQTKQKNLICFCFNFLYFFFFARKKEEVRKKSPSFYLFCFPLVISPHYLVSYTQSRLLKSSTSFTFSFFLSPFEHSHKDSTR